jgi:hypothetical protein
MIMRHEVDMGGEGAATQSHRPVLAAARAAMLRRSDESVLAGSIALA